MRVFHLSWIALFLLPAAFTTVNAQQLGREFDLFEQTQRIDIVTELCHAMKVNYALWSLKASRTGVASEKVCADAIAREKAKADPIAEPLAQAKVNLEFLDNMQLLQAAFHDSHLYLAASIGRARIRMPFKVAEVSGKVIVVSVEPLLLKSLSQDPEVTAIEVGDELVAIAGFPATAAAAKLIPWAADSSPLGARQHSVTFLTDRSFQFPETPSLTFTIHRRGQAQSFEATLPWVYDAVYRADEKLFFDRSGYHAPVGMMKKTFDPKKAALVPVPNWSHGYDNDTLPKQLKEPQFLFSTDDFQPAAIGGFYEEGGKQTAAVLQLRGFPSNVMSPKAMSLQGNDFAESVGEILAGLQKNGLPLIVDLRHNFGGSLDQASSIAKLFIPEGKMIPGVSQALPLTHQNRQMNDLVDLPAGPPPLSTGAKSAQTKTPEFSADDVRQLLKLAASTKAPLTAAFVREDLKGHGDQAALGNGVAVLITPECISACEILVSLLKRSGVAVIIGSETDGTGSGYAMGGPVNGNWKDDYSTFRALLPNFLFGTPGDVLGKRVYPGEADARCSEQKPSRADAGQEYTTQLQADVIDGDKGWMRKALNALAPKAPQP